MKKTSESHQEFDSHNLAYMEGMYLEFLRNPHAVGPYWRQYFKKISMIDPFTSDPRLRPSFRPKSLFHAADSNGDRENSDKNGGAELQWRVDQLIHAFRVQGHLAADINPLEGGRRRPEELDPEYYGLTKADTGKRFYIQTGHGPKLLSLCQILKRMQNTYCRKIGVEFMHIVNDQEKTWLRDRIEAWEKHSELKTELKMRILNCLLEAVVFEEFIRKKYLGAKSFSLEGAESLIPLLDFAIAKLATVGIEEIVLGMAHRGRLNVLVNIMGKRPREIFREFEDRDPELYFSRGDVKYHLGYVSERLCEEGKKLRLSLCFNPSHLEFINPVVSGRVRAKQERMGDSERKRCMGIIIHGDAAFIGEGIVQESLNLSQLDAYSTGGTLHIVLNNQLGFTTPSSEGRSSMYASDVARMLDIPVIHVNGQDPEAIIHAAELALEFRNTFNRDVVIDMYCFRKWGHNEGDEPSFTQPLMYHQIGKQESVLELYLKRLVKLGEMTSDQIDAIAEIRTKDLEEELSQARGDFAPSPSLFKDVTWQGYFGGPESKAKEVDTTVPLDRLKYLLEKQTEMPDNFHPHPKIDRALKRRKKMVSGEVPVDWSAAEALAFASLAIEGVPIRLTGQDSARGTFNQRHAVLYDTEDGHAIVPLRHLCEGQASVEIRNSPLSETGVLGFEYGYSLDLPNGLVLWEAQFGDFCNAAQVIIDQFIVSAEDKWENLSGLVLLLPHGFDGSGPEHSSARLERFLLLAAEDNIQVICPSTPAQYFHCLRRQALRRWRKPLIIMTPKSLLRHPQSVSCLDELSGGNFQRVIPDTCDRGRKKKRIIFCSGKIFFELQEARKDLEREDVALIRLEQFYPLADKDLFSVFGQYPDETPVIWVQEEPENMGGWRYLQTRFREKLFGRFPFSCVSRMESASPATGSSASHKVEQRQIIEKAFSDGLS